MLFILESFLLISDISRFTGSFWVEIHIVFYCQYVEFCIAAYEKVHLDLHQSFFKIKLKAHSQLSKKCAILSSCKNFSNVLCLIMKILTEKTLYISHFLLCQQPYSIWTITQDLIKLGTYNISNPSMYEVFTLRMKHVASVEESN